MNCLSLTDRYPFVTIFFVLNNCQTCRQFSAWLWVWELGRIPWTGTDEQGWLVHNRLTHQNLPCFFELGRFATSVLIDAICQKGRKEWILENGASTVRMHNSLKIGMECHSCHTERPADRTDLTLHVNPNKRTSGNYCQSVVQILVKSCIKRYKWILYKTGPKYILCWKGSMLASQAFYPQCYRPHSS